MRAWLLVLLFCTACSEFRLDPIDPDGEPQELIVVEDWFVQESLPAVDLLFVIDNTASMGQEQEALAAGFDALLDALVLADVAWQIGVVSTTVTGPDAGVLVGDPWILSPTTPQVETAFGALARVGVDGQAPEAGLAAAVAALDLTAEGGPNAGFRRDNASLRVIFVSDADDGSDTMVEGDPAAIFLTRIQDEADRTGRDAQAAAIVGDLPDGCVSATASASAGTRYHAVVEASHGATESICASNYHGILADLARVDAPLERRFVLQETPEAPLEIKVRIDGVSTSSWTFEMDPPSVVFDEPPPGASTIVISYLVKNR